MTAEASRIVPPPPIRLGTVEIAFPVALAALSGYGDWPTRVIARRLGAGYTIAEVLLDKFVVNVSKGRKAKRFIRVSDDDHPTGAQLMGSAADEFAPAAITLVEAGFDVIDINFGCPVKKVLGRCRGGYLLSQPETALEIVARVRDAVPERIPVTVKMRRGMDDSEESLDRFYRIFDGAFALGVAGVTIHGRTVRQRYEGRSRWDFLREVKERAGTRIVWGSGDLFTAQDCFDMIAQTGVDGVTVARGAIGNPWIFREIRTLAAGQPMPPPPSLAEQRDVMLEHYRLAESLCGPKRGCSVMNKHGIKYSRLHPEMEKVRAAFAASHSPEQWHAVIRQWYDAGSD
jgi:nifR3 family TIM-barrel protein